MFPNTPAFQRQEHHHELVQKGVEFIVSEEKSVGGQLGRPSGAQVPHLRAAQTIRGRGQGNSLRIAPLHKAIDEIYRYPLRQTATDTLNRQLRSGVSDESLAELVVALRDEGRLCLVHEEEQTQEPMIICSLGLAGGKEKYAGEYYKNPRAA